MRTILSRLIDNIERIKSAGVSEKEMEELKKALIDRIGCTLAARRIGVGTVYGSLTQRGSGGPSSIWGTTLKTEPSNAALINGAISSRLEYDTHDSMIPAAVALGEQLGSSGETHLMSLKAGYFTGLAARRLLASEIERRGLHWPAYLAALSAAAACSTILGLSGHETGNAIGIAASLCPVSPFEAFTRGATVKDLYGGWGDMIGVESAKLAASGWTSPDTVFEGKRGLFKNWLGRIPEKEEIEAALHLEDDDIVFHFKPFPCCTAAIPTLTAIESLLKNHSSLSVENITSISIDTYHFGFSLSEESDPSTPIGAKINIPFLAASMLVHGKLLPEHTEKPSINDQRIKKLSSLVHLTSGSSMELQSRHRYAKVALEMKDGERHEAYSDAPKWSSVPATRSDIIEKFNENVGSFLGDTLKESIISKIVEIETLEDIGELTILLTA